MRCLELSNSGCLPGRAGGSPVFTSRFFLALVSACLLLPTPALPQSTINDEFGIDDDFTFFNFTNQFSQRSFATVGFNDEEDENGEPIDEIIVTAEAWTDGTFAANIYMLLANSAMQAHCVETDNEGNCVLGPPHFHFDEEDNQQCETYHIETQPFTLQEAIQYNSDENFRNSVAGTLAGVLIGMVFPGGPQGGTIGGAVGLAMSENMPTTPVSDNDVIHATVKACMGSPWEGGGSAINVISMSIERGN